jgi:hypothetical protein
MIKRWVLFTGIVLSLAAVAAADEGMWLFNHPPAAQIKAKYGFTLTSAWLEHVQLSSVRFNNGGSGSFVSADGLAFTNHHVAQTCLHGLSTADKDLYKTGFYAKSYAEEPRCPDLELNVLVGIEDVTDKVNAGVKPGMAAAAAGAAQRGATSQIEADCNKITGLRCDVVTFYSGAIYHLYRYKRYTDVRLVFAPEFDIAFFGGDPDNFEFPRYDLDVAFFRVYENGKPVHIEHYLKWSAGGLKDNDLVFISGHPGSTGRLLTMSQLESLRTVVFPFQLEILNRRDQLFRNWGAKSEENYRRAQEDLFGIENNLKRLKVYYTSLSDPAIMDKKQAEETTLKQTLSADPQKKAEYGNPWAEVDQAIKVQQEIYLPLTLIERDYAFRGDLAGFARTLVRLAIEKTKPNATRLHEYSESALPSLEQRLFASTPIYKDMEEVELADSLATLQEKLPNDPATQLVLKGRAPAAVAHELIANTKLDDINVRKQLYQGGLEAIGASTDPLIVLMRTIDPEARKYRSRYDDEVDSVVRQAGGAIGRLRFARDGYNVPPDATFTLRLSYGPVRGYVEDGLGDVVPKDTKIPPFTQIGGAFTRADKMGNKDPFRLPKSWLDAKQAGKLKLDTPFDSVSTGDIIGGNSGSPVINTAGELVGIIFDGNMQSLPWIYVYDDVAGRAVSVDSRGILEALRDVYGATRVSEELTGSK